MSGEIPSDCVYDAWGADYGVQAGARCLNDDPAHRAAHHGGPETDDGEPVSMPWRLDLPRAPERVTAFKDGTGSIWVRGLISPRRQRWAQWSDDPHAWQDAEWVDVYTALAHGPLVECEDPRAAS